jgi:MFS family permease
MSRTPTRSDSAGGIPADAATAGTTPPLTTDALARIQTRTVWTLVAGQVLGGLGIGATVSFGALLAAHISGNDALSGTAATLTTLGAAAAAIPLARLARARGRRIALTSGILLSAVGAVVVVTAAAVVLFPLLLAGFALLGVGAAVNLQSRFAATDLATPNTRGRQLSLVVWSTTIGSVVGPNLSGPGDAVGTALGMPHLTGSFTFAIAAQLLAAAVYLIALRPDPYLLSQKTAAARAPAHNSVEVDVAEPAPATPAPSSRGDEEAAATSTKRLTIYAIGAIAAAHAVMVGVMAMTPLHLNHHGSTDGQVGFTISLHIAGMFALSPVFGWLSDRWDW